MVPTQELEGNGGLHVCFTYFPDNLRVEIQGFGRTARNNNRGTTQYIIKTNYSSIDEMSKRRDLREKKASSFYSKIACGAMFKDEYMREFASLVKNTVEKASENDKDWYKLNMYEGWGYFLDETINNNIYLSTIENQNLFSQSFLQFTERVVSKEILENSSTSNSIHKILSDLTPDNASAARSNLKTIISNDKAFSLMAHYILSRLLIERNCSRVPKEGSENIKFMQELNEGISALHETDVILSYFYLEEVLFKQSWFPDIVVSDENNKNTGGNQRTIRNYNYYEMMVYVLFLIKNNITQNILILEEKLLTCNDNQVLIIHIFNIVDYFTECSEDAKELENNPNFYAVIEELKSQECRELFVLELRSYMRVKDMFYLVLLIVLQLAAAAFLNLAGLPCASILVIALIFSAATDLFKLANGATSWEPFTWNDYFAGKLALFSMFATLFIFTEIISGFSVTRDSGHFQLLLIS